MAQGGIVGILKIMIRGVEICIQELLISSAYWMACLQTERKPSLERGLVYCSIGGVLLGSAQLCGITAQQDLSKVASTGSPDSAYRLCTLLVLKAAVQRHTAGLWRGLSINKI
jgi:hypothetical protein